MRFKIKHNHSTGCIYDTNRFTLHTQLSQLGCTVLDFGIIEDNQASLIQTLEQAAQTADLVISSGGVSVGHADYIKSALSALGQINFWRVNMRPGRPRIWASFTNQRKRPCHFLVYRAIQWQP